MIDLSQHCEDSINDGEFGDDQLCALAAQKLARLIAEDVCAALSTFIDKALATSRGSISEGKFAVAIRDFRASTANPLADAITAIVLARAMSAR